jgi:hypothetical protein
MIGEHPEMYGLPELNLFVAGRMRERSSLIDRLPTMNDGLLRATAQVIAGEQTPQTIALARQWLAVRAESSCTGVFHELAAFMDPRVPVEKSPMTVLHAEYLQRLRREVPRARYVHLVRHPRTQGESMWNFGGMYAGVRLGAIDYSTEPPSLDVQVAWYRLNMNIITFLDGVAQDLQVMIRGEELLADPDKHLREIAEWLGLRTDAQAMEAMKHPERSPFACIGPIGAQFGNDPDFLANPKLRKGSPRTAGFEGPVPWRRDGAGLSADVRRLAEDFGYA